MDARRQALVDQLLRARGLSCRPVETPAVVRPLARLSQLGQMLALSRLVPAAPQFHINSAREILGPLDESRLRLALRLLLERHESLRTIYREDGDSLVPQLLPTVESEFAAERSSELNRIADTERRRPFDLNRGPLLRARLVQLDRARHWMLLTVHHAACDYASVEILWRDLGAIHRALATGDAVSLPPLKQFTDFAAWQARCSTSERLAASVAWCRANLGAPEPPTLFGGADPSPTLLMARVSLDATDLWETLPAFAARHHTTPFVVALAAFAVVLHYALGRDPVRIATPVSNRDRDEFRDTVGLLVNTLVLPVAVDPRHSFMDQIERSRAALSSSLSYADVAFETMVLALAADTALDPGALFRVMIVYRPEDPRLIASGPIEIVPGEPLGEPSAPEIVLTGLDMVLGVDVAARRCSLSLLHKVRHVPPASAERLLSTLKSFLAAAMADAGAPVGSLLATATEMGGVDK